MYVMYLTIPIGISMRMRSKNLCIVWCCWAHASTCWFSQHEKQQAEGGLRSIVHHNSHLQTLSSAHSYCCTVHGIFQHGMKVRTKYVVVWKVVIYSVQDGMLCAVHPGVSGDDACWQICNLTPYLNQCLNLNLNLINLLRDSNPSCLPQKDVSSR